MKCSVIGNGRFGGLLASLLTQYVDVDVFDVGVQPNPCGSDYIFLCVPIRHLEAAAKSIHDVNNGGGNSKIVSMCSVMEYPFKVLSQIFRRDDLIIAHPLFGPTTPVKDRKIVVMEPEWNGQSYLPISAPRIIMTAEGHDRWMAKTQALAFAIGGALETHPVPTKSYGVLNGLRDSILKESQELREDIITYNQYARAEIRAFCDRLPPSEART